MLVKTESGSSYTVNPSLMKSGLPCLEVYRDGVDGEFWVKKCVAVYPDRLDSFLASVSFEELNGKLVGRNKAGKVTCQFYVDQVRNGMYLVNTKGFKSTIIVSVV